PPVKCGEISSIGSDRAATSGCDAPGDRRALIPWRNGSPSTGRGTPVAQDSTGTRFNGWDLIPGQVRVEPLRPAEPVRRLGGPGRRLGGGAGRGAAAGLHLRGQ